MNESIDVSIVIVNYNTPDLVQKAVDSCLSASRGLAVEIIVVDNNSSKKLTKNTFKDNRISVIEERENSGFASAVNKGVKRSRGRYCLLLNSDAQVFDGAIHQMVNTLDILPQAACVGGRIKDKDDHTEVSWGYFPNLFVEFRLKIYKILLDNLGFVRKGFEKKMATPRKVDWISGAFMMFKREPFDKINGFDGDYFLYFEDIDFCRRLMDEGYYAYYQPLAECFHERGASVRGIPQKEALRIKRESQRRYYSKHNGFISSFFLKWVTAGR